jgi:exodeoxyribonuclease V beta subunit
VRPLEPMKLPLRGLHLIEASAGTGKTYTITTLFVRLLVEAALPVDRVLVVTFTEAATAELQGRVRDRIAATLRLDDEDELTHELVRRFGEDVVRARLSQALHDFDECAISTIHGFCSRMLAENAFESGVAYDTGLERDVRALLREMATDFWVTRVQDMDPLLLQYLGKKQVTLDALTELAEAVVSQPDRALVPDSVVSQDVPALFRQRADHARQLWQEHRDVVETLLREDEGLYSRSYTDRNITNWLAHADDWFSQADPVPWELGNLIKFSPAALHDKVKDGCTLLEHPCFTAIGELCELPAMLDDQVTSLRLDLAAYVSIEHRRRKEDSGTHSFDDMLQRLDEAVVGPGGERLCRAIRGRFRAALIDEFQDTDRTQYRIFSRVYGGTDAPLLLIGDPKQSIYAFRGADVFSYLQAARDARESARTLDTNWRSSPRMIQAVNTLFGRIEHPFVFDQIDFTPAVAQDKSRDTLVVEGVDEPALQFRFLPREGRVGSRGRIVGEWHKKNLPTVVANDIAHLLASRTGIEDRHLRASDVAVLVRENRQALQMQQALRALHIPAVLHSEFTVFESDEARDVHALLAAVADPGRVGAVRAALTTNIIGLTGDNLASLDEDDPRWDRWLRRFGRWRELWDRRGFTRMFRTVLDHRRGGRPLRARLLELDDGARRLTNLHHIEELLHDATVRQRLGIRGLLRWLRRELAGDGAAGDAAQLRLETDETAVQLVTIHKSKGLEYPVVYCPYLWSSDVRKPRIPLSFHDEDDRARLDVGSTEYKRHAGRRAREELAEGSRVAYVALTRAKHLAVVLWGGFEGMEKSALAGLLHGHDGESKSRAPAAIPRLDDDELCADLQRLADASDGTIGVATLDESPAPPYCPAETAEVELCARIASRELPLWRRTSSFSGLVADHEADEKDHDAVTELAEPPPAPDRTGPPAHLVGFPGGRTAGSCFHTIYEHADFADRDDLRAVTEDKLAAFGFDAARWSGDVAAAIGASLDTDVGGFTLSQLSKDDRLDELEFILPAQGELVTADQIAAVLRVSDVFPAGYLQRVADLGFVPLRGYLKGFIDLVFCRQGQWHVVDYKSNRLGDHMAAYSDEAMGREMAHHHYFLQYHLYVVALHRLLRYRIPDYDYDRHFGSALYLFFRGMAPANGPKYGVFRDRPRRELVEELSALFDEKAIHGERS